MSKFRFHIVGLPHTSVTLAYTACAFTERVRKFCSMMYGLGHEVFLYAGPDKTDADVTGHFTCISEAERAAACGGRHFVHASFDNTLPHWQRFNQNAIIGIDAHIQPHDFICIIGGLAHKPILDAFPAHIGVEFSIGYGGNFAKYRIWESYAWMHTCYGAQSGGDPNAIDGRWFDTVIPGSFDPADFPLCDKEDYCVFLGRLTPRKGIGVAVETCRRLGMRLVIAGQGDPPDYGEYVGVVGPEERGKLLAGARAAFVCASYIEPFGNAAVEAQLCGTPVLASPWGAMTETVEDGKTGFLCHTLREFMDGVRRAGELDPDYIRDRAIRLYSTDAVARQYARHFRRLESLWREGWYDDAPYSDAPQGGDSSHG
jgi:glycosyltransferase involved in cell wall biosynthesis